MAPPKFIPPQNRPLARLAACLIGPAMLAAAIGAWLQTRSLIADQGHLEAGRDHLAAMLISTEVLRSVTLTFIATLPLVFWASVRMWRGSKLRVFAYCAYAVEAAWLSFVLQGPEAWGTTHFRFGLPLPHVFWMGSALMDRLLLTAVLGILALIFSLRMKRRPAPAAQQWPGPLTGIIGWACLIGAFAATASAALKPNGAAPTPSSRNHVLLLTLGSARPEEMARTSDDSTRTPHLREFCEQALLFENAFAQSPNAQDSCESFLGIAHSHANSPAADSTLAESLRNAGYATHAFVRSENLDFHTGLQRGFERIHLFDSNTSHQRFATDIGEEFTSLAKGFRPIFIFAYFDLIQAEKSGAQLQDASGVSVVDHRNRSLTAADLAAASLINRLKSAKLFAESMLIVHADVGFPLEQKPSRKDLNVEFVHVPLLIHFPDEMRLARRTDDRMAENLDIFPTIMHALEIEPLERWTQSDTRGDQASAPRPLSLLIDPPQRLTSVSSVANRVAIRTREWTLMFDPSADPTTLFYDRLQDPLERNPLLKAGDSTDAAILEKELKHWHLSHPKSSR